MRDKSWLKNIPFILLAGAVGLSPRIPIGAISGEAGQKIKYIGWGITRKKENAA